MRVLINVDIPGNPSQAALLQIVRVAYFLAASGTHVRLYVNSDYFDNGAELLAFFGFSSLKLLEIRMSRRAVYPGALSRLPALAFHLRRLLAVVLLRRDADVDVFFARGVKFTTLQVFLRRLLPYRIVYEAHEVFYLNEVPEDKLLTFSRWPDFEAYCYRNSHGVIAITAALRNLLAMRFGPKEQLTVIPSGFVPFEARETGPAGKTSTAIFYVGNCYPLSGMEPLIDAVAQVADAQLHIIGGGAHGSSYVEQLRNRSKDKKVSHRVIFEPFVPPSELPEVFARADILAMPYSDCTRTRHMMSPLKMFEYMCARRPIISTDLPPVREVLRHEHNALLVPPDDPQALARAIERLAKDPELATRLASQAHRDSHQYTMQKKCSLMATFMEKICVDA